MKATAKRRRSKIEILEAKRREEEEKNAINQRLQEIAALKQELTDVNAKIGMASNLHTQVQNLVNMGIVKQNERGNLIPI